MCYNGMDVVYKEGGGHTSAENMEVIMKSEQSLYIYGCVVVWLVPCCFFLSPMIFLSVERVHYNYSTAPLHHCIG
jgi:hypothetical protein